MAPTPFTDGKPSEITMTSDLVSGRFIEAARIPTASRAKPSALPPAMLWSILVEPFEASPGS